METARLPSGRRTRKSTALALVFLLAVPLWAADSASAAPGGGWSTPMDLKTSLATSWAVDVATDGHGNAIAAYIDADGSTYPAYVRHFIAGLGWQPERQVSTGSYANDVSISMNEAGDAIVGIADWNGSAWTATTARYTRDVGWSSTVALSPMNGNTYYVSTAMDGLGNGYVAAQTWQGAVYQVRAAVSFQNGTLDPAIRLDNGTGSMSVDLPPRAAASAAPGALFAWYSYNGTNSDLFSRRHNGTAWQGVRQMEFLGGGVGAPQVGLDDSGNALGAYFQNVNGYWHVWYTTQSPTGAWQPGQETGHYYDAFSLVVSRGGQAAIVSIVWNGSANVLAANRYIPGIGFDALVNTNDSLYWGMAPVAAMDANGNVAVLYHHNDGSYPVLWSARFSGSRWTSFAQVQEVPANGESFGGHVAFLADGRAVAVWLEHDSTYSLASPRTNLQQVLPDTAAPWVKITSPFDGVVTNTPSMNVAGWAEPGATVSVNGLAATVNSKGQFSITLPLTEGGQWVTALAADEAGFGTFSNGVWVTYTDPQDLLDAERATLGRGGFLNPVGIESINYWSAWWPLIETDRNGNAFAVWYEYSGLGDHAYVNRYVNGTGWGTPMLLQGEPGQLWGHPRLAVDAGGNATVIWGVHDSAHARAHVYAVWYTVQLGRWFNAFKVDTGARYGWWPDVAVSPTTGRHHMVWHQRDEVTLNYSIHSRFFQFPSSVSATSQIETVGGNNELANIAFDGSGRGYVGFRNWNGSAFNVGMARYTGAAWNQSIILQANTPSIWNVPVAADAGGNATFAWKTYNGTEHVFAGRLYANGTYSGASLVLNNTWNWDPEVLATNDGRAFIGLTADRGGMSSSVFVATAGGGSNTWSVTNLDANSANSGGGPKFSTGWGGSPVRVHFDEHYDGYWHAQMREYAPGNGTWGPIIELGTPGVSTHIPDVAPMPDGGLWALWAEENATLGYNQIVARRVTIFDTTPPALNVTSPANGSTTNLSYAELRGTAEVGARVWVNNIEMVVAPNGSFITVVPLVNGSNTISLRAVDINGVWNNKTHLIVFADPAMALIASLTAQNLALQAAFVAANNSLWAALAGQNASLLGEIAATNASLAAAIAAGDASLLAQLIAQNATLQAAISAGDALLLAQLITQNATLQAAISAGDMALLASLASQNATLAAAIAAGDAALFADLVALNASLAATVAGVNAALLASLAAQNASLLATIASTNASLLAQLIAQNASVALALSDLNATLLATIAAENAGLMQVIAATNASLLAELAAQNDDLLLRIAATNRTLLAELAAQNATLWAKLTADNGALWNSLNATNGVNANQNGTLAATQDDVNAAQAAAASAATMGMVGALLGVVGMAIGALAIILSRKRGPPPMESSPPPPHVEGVEVAAVEVTPEAAPHSAGQGGSMAAQGELTSAES